MARPAYTDIADTQIDLDSGVNEDWLEDMRDNIESMRLQVFGVDIVEDTELDNSTFQDVANSAFRVWIPDVADYTGIQRTVNLVVETKVDAAITGTLRLYDVTNTTAGTDEQTTTSNGVYEDKTLTIDVDADDKGSVLNFKVQMKTNGNGTTENVYCRALDSYTGYVEY